MRKFLVITACQRTGTTALGSALGATGEFGHFGEIFHDAPDRTNSFVDWMRSKQKLWVDTFSPKGAQSTADEYFDFLAAASGEASPLVDIKLNSWMTFHPGWTYPAQKPFLMDYLQRRGAAFLYIRRRDLASQILSEFIARKVGKWHGITDGEATNVRLAVPVGEVRERALNIISAEKLVSASLAGAPRALAIWYEELYQNGIVSPDVTSFLNREFDLSLRELKPQIEKNAGDKSALVENYAEVLAAIREIEQTALRPL